MSPAGNRYKFKDAAIMHCPACRNEVLISLHLLTKSAVCEHCKTLFDTENYSKTGKLKGSKKKPVILPGSKAVIKGTNYRVCAYILKKEVNQQVYWFEYLLFNPIEGFVCLTEYTGHWILLKDTSRHPRTGRAPSDFLIDGLKFEKFLQYKHEVIDAGGEFPYNLKAQEDFLFVEYINPPFIYIKTDGEDEVFWQKGEHIEADEIQKAFGVEKMPVKKGIGAVQPVKTEEVFFRSKTLFLFFILLLTITLMAFEFSFDDVKKFETAGRVGGRDSFQFVRGASFHLDKGYQNLEIEVQSPLQGTWLDLEMELVNEDNGEEIVFSKSLEYYSGYSDGESWSEGSQNESVLLSSLPAGNYHLNYKPVCSTLYENTFFISVNADVPIWRNYFFMLLFALIWPIVSFMKARNVNAQRWSNSNLVY